MKHFFYTLICVFGLVSTSNAQLADGTIAPDFTVTDIEGNTHNLYSYLNAGKHVVLDFSATWCGPCWSFHQTHALKNIYELYGPNGSDDVMVIWIEGENNNSTQCLYGNGGACTGVYPNSSQGNWIIDNPYPFVDLSAIGQNGLKAQYAIGFFPTLYMINHHTNKIYERSWSIGQAGIESFLFGSFEMDLSLTVDNADPCPGTASITATGIGGAGQINYTWSNGATTSTISNLAPGNYTCTVSDANDFQIISPVTVITGPPTINTTLLNLTNVSCFGESNGEITVNAVGGYGGFTYDWDNGQSGANLVNLPGGSYTCIATDVQGCNKTIGPFNITEPTILLTETSNTNPTCGQTNGVIAMQTTGGTSPYQYTLNSVTQNTPVFPNLPGGTYNFSVVDDNGCNVSGTTSLINSTPPTAQTSSVGSISCINASAQVSGNGSSTGNNIEYQWTTTNGTILSGANDIVATVGAAGTYQLTVRNVTNNCITSSSTVMPANVELPSASVATPGSLTCSTTSLNLDGTASSTGSNFTYLWTTTDGNITAGSTTLTPTVNQSGTYNLLVTNTTNGCVRNANTSVTANTTPPTVSVPANLELTCTQSSAEICATSNATNFSWSNGSTQSCTTANSAGTYTLTATGANGCTTQASTTVTASNDIPQVNIAAPGMVTCTVPNITISGTVSTSGTYTYLWTTSNGTIVSGADTPNAVVSSAGTYTLIATNTTSGCSGTQAVTVDQLSAAPASTYTSVTNGNMVTGTASASASTTTFSWTLNGTSVGTASSVTVDLTLPGTYNLCLIATNDCGSNTSCSEFTVLAALSGTSTSVNAKCFESNDGSAVAIANGGKAPYTYAWIGPNTFTATTSSINGLAVGNYTCVITDDLGATITTSVTITQPTAISVQTQSVTDDTNNSGSGAINLVMTGGTGAYTYLWSNGQTTQNLTNIGAGSYTCVVTDVNGCNRSVGPIVVANISSVDEAKFVNIISVFPNPATTMIRIDVSFKNALQSSVSLVNSLGQTVMTKSYSTTAITDTYDVTSLPSGIYNLAISNGEFTTLRKIIIAK